MLCRSISHTQTKISSSRYTHFMRQKNRFASYSTTQYYYSLFPNGKQSRVKTTFSQSSRARMFYGNFLWWFLLWHTNYHLVNVCDLALKQREGASYSIVESEKGWYFANEIRQYFLTKKPEFCYCHLQVHILKWPLFKMAISWLLIDSFGALFREKPSVVAFTCCKGLAQLLMLRRWWW